MNTPNYPDWGYEAPSKLSAIFKLLITALLVAGLLCFFQFIVITSNYFGTNDGTRCMSTGSN